MGRPNAVGAILAKHPGQELHNAALTAYADCGAHRRFDALLKATSIKLTQEDYQRFAWKFAHKGHLGRTNAMLEKLDPATKENQDLILLTAHRSAAHNLLHFRVSSQGVYGQTLSQKNDSVLDVASWEKLAVEDDTTTHLDVEKCYLILDYLCTANLLDSTRFPMQRAEDFLKRQIISRNPKEKARMYGILLNGYSRTQEYADGKGSNTRLDKALALFEDMKEIKLEYRRTFHALLRACIPHRDEKYPFDYVELTSAIENTPPPMRLDPRFFKIERIMLDSQVRYDKKSILTAMTCLGAARHYPAMWRRFHTLKLSGVRRSQSAFRVAFSLASMDRQASEYALSVIKEELVHEMPDKVLNLDLYQAMLDCCVTAKDSRVAKQIVGTMAQHYPKNHHENSPVSYAQSVLRAATLLDGLEDAGRHALELLAKAPPAYNDRTWVWALAFKATHGGQDAAARIQEMQHTFTQYTMKRFESIGKIPIPVRESSPVVTFPSGPYSFLDIRMINMYVHSLVDSQDASLLVDVLNTFKSQKTDGQHLTTRAQSAVRYLLEQEQNDDIDSILQDL